MDLGALFSHSRTALLLCDDDRRITEVNAAARALLREPAERLVGRLPEDLVAAAGRPAAARELASVGAPSGAPGWLPFAVQRGDGVDFRGELTWRSDYLPGRHLVALRRARPAGELAGDDRLSERESAILTRVARGMTGPEIADELFLSTATVERHVASALRRLGARNRAHGIAIAVRTGQLEPDVAGASAPTTPAARAGTASAVPQLVLEALEDPAALLGTDGGVLLVNDAWRGLADRGGLFEAAPGANVLELCDRAAAGSPDAAEAAWGLREVLEGHVACFTIEYHDGGAEHGPWFEMRVTRHGTEDSGTFLLRHRDVTARRRAERRAEIGAALLDEVDAAVAILDLDGTVVDWRGNAERMFGVRAADAVGRPAWEVVMARGDHRLGRSIVEDVVREERWAGELDLVRDDGSVLSADVRLRVLRGDDGEPARIVAAAVDVTERVAALREVMHATEQLRAVTSSMRDGCLVMDATGRIIDANPAAVAIIGWTREDLLGRDLHGTLRSPVPGGASPRPLREGPGGPVHEDRFVARDGREVPLEYTATRFTAMDNADRWAIVFRPLSAYGEPLDQQELDEADRD